MLGLAPVGELVADELLHADSARLATARPAIALATLVTLIRSLLQVARTTSSPQLRVGRHRGSLIRE
jgi:hypothetical protein